MTNWYCWTSDSSLLKIPKGENFNNFQEPQCSVAQGPTVTLLHCTWTYTLEVAKKWRMFFKDFKHKDSMFAKQEDTVWGAPDYFLKWGEPGYREQQIQATNIPIGDGAIYPPKSLAVTPSISTGCSVWETGEICWASRKDFKPGQPSNHQWECNTERDVSYPTTKLCG